MPWVAPRAKLGQFNAPQFSHWPGNWRSAGTSVLSSLEASIESRGAADLLADGGLRGLVAPPIMTGLLAWTWSSCHPDRRLTSAGSRIPGFSLAPSVAPLFLDKEGNLNIPSTFALRARRFCFRAKHQVKRNSLARLSRPRLPDKPLTSCLGDSRGKRLCGSLLGCRQRDSQVVQSQSHVRAASINLINSFPVEEPIPRCAANQSRLLARGHLFSPWAGPNSQQFSST